MDMEHFVGYNIVSIYRKKITKVLYLDQNTDEKETDL